MFTVLWVGNSGRSQWVRWGAEDMALLWSMYLGTSWGGLTCWRWLEWLNQDHTSEALNLLCMASTRAETSMVVASLTGRVPKLGQLGQ